MDKVVISVLGQDRPGIIAAVSKILFENGCNIENVSQTILQTEFAGIFIALIPDNLTIEQLQSCFEKALLPMGLHAYVKDLEYAGGETVAIQSEPFVITTKGPDRKGLVAGITRVISDFGVNITNMQAVFKGGDDPDRNITIYEVDVPRNTDQSNLRNALREKAAELGLTISIQHRNIFQALNRI